MIPERTQTYTAITETLGVYDDCDDDLRSSKVRAKCATINADITRAVDQGKRLAEFERQMRP